MPKSLIYSQNLRQRIARVTMNGRPIPRSTNIDVLGGELKIRLAATSPIITEKVGRDRRVRVTEVFAKTRSVPVLDIDEEFDCVVRSQTKIHTYYR